MTSTKSVNFLPNSLATTDLETLKTNVPNIRLEHRHQVLVDEIAMIRANNSTQNYELHPAVLLTSDTVAARAMATHT
jgi:hypothetical protein